jgi:hypothetical protein
MTSIDHLSNTKMELYTPTLGLGKPLRSQIIDTYMTGSTSTTTILSNTIGSKTMFTKVMNFILIQTRNDFDQSQIIVPQSHRRDKLRPYKHKKFITVLRVLGSLVVGSVKKTSNKFFACAEKCLDEQVQSRNA